MKISGLIATPVFDGAKEEDVTSMLKLKSSKFDKPFYGMVEQEKI